MQISFTDHENEIFIGNINEVRMWQTVNKLGEILKEHNEKMVVMKNGHGIQPYFQSLIIGATQF
ncbi:hypothetical protein GCM10007049_05150 [Echinicola pacifica]|uniref:Uncharacterized protein n=1 Tax=Echinicola pacifica TaxID=346377 RepID=A0A918UK70_9BACT|nr:hypothetical protein GCM10007049_05150 [Echinicola pacifica]